MLERIEFMIHDMYGVEYRQAGVKHRPNGPAFVMEEHSWYIWYLYGHKHRYYGYCNPVNMWWIHGEQIK
jgi:hypothetical protein